MTTKITLTPDYRTELPEVEIIIQGINLMGFENMVTARYNVENFAQRLPEGTSVHEIIPFIITVQNEQ